MFAAFIFYYMIEEILELRSMRLAYFASFWNWLDIFVLTVRKDCGSALRHLLDSTFSLGFNRHFNLQRVHNDQSVDVAQVTAS